MATIAEALTQTDHSGSGAKSQAITLPGGTLAIVAMWIRDNDSATISGVSFGNVAMDLVADIAMSAGSTTNTGRLIMYDEADISGRADDVLRWTQSGDLNLSVYAITGTGSIVRVDSGSGVSSDTLEPAGSCVAAQIAGITRIGAIASEIDTVASLTTTSEGQPATTGTWANYSLANSASSSLGVGVVSANNNSKRGFIAALYAEVTLVMPDPPGAEVGIPDTFTIDTGPAAIQSFAIGGAEVGIPPSFRVTATGPAHVLLNVIAKDRPQMTEGGTEGQVLTYHTSRKPSWEDTAATSDLTSLFIDTSVSGAHTVDRADGATHDLTLTGNATLTPDHSDPTAGEAIDLRILIRQDGTGGRTLGWGGTIDWVGGSEPTMPTGADEMITVGLLSVDDAVSWIGYIVEDSIAGIEVAEADGAPDVSGVTRIEIDGDATVTDDGGGQVTITVDGGSVTGAQLVAMGVVGALLIGDDHSTPIVFGDLLLTEDGSDFLYGDIG